MTMPVKRLERMRVAAPCPASWQSMSGDDRVRFCDQCQLHVYDISQLTSREATALINSTEGRICGRLYRRADGTILTKDCPTGLRAVRRRLAATAGTAFAALLSLCASALGQSFTYTSRQDAGPQQFVTLSRTFRGTSPQEGRATLRGVITDPNGVSVPGAEVKLINEKTKGQRTVKADDKGSFELALLEPGAYTLKINFPGFEEYQQEHLKLFSNEETRFDVSLNIAATVGIIVCEEPPEKGIIIDGVRVRINE